MKTKHLLFMEFLKKIVTGFIIIILIAWNLNCFGQDTLVQRKGNVILSRITEVSGTQIKYNKFDNVNGPVYIIDKNEIAYIKYTNGVVDTIPEFQFTAVVKKQEQAPAPVFISSKIIPYGQKYKLKEKIYSSYGVLGLLKKLPDPEIGIYSKKARTAKALRPVCFVAIPIALAGLTGLIDSRTAEQVALSSTLLVVAGAGIGVSITLHSIEKKNTAAAIRLYNEKY